MVYLKIWLRHIYTWCNTVFSFTLVVLLKIVLDCSVCKWLLHVCMSELMLRSCLKILFVFFNSPTFHSRLLIKGASFSSSSCSLSLSLGFSVLPLLSPPSGSVIYLDLHTCDQTRYRRDLPILGLQIRVPPEALKQLCKQHAHMTSICF